MNIANISYARNHLSELVNRVRDGESILIVDRNTPVAQLEPVSARMQAQARWGKDLVRRGIVRPARGRLNPKGLAALALPTAGKGGDILAALVAEREEGR